MDIMDLVHLGFKLLEMGLFIVYAVVAFCILYILWFTAVAVVFWVLPETIVVRRRHIPLRFSLDF